MDEAPAPPPSAPPAWAFRGRSARSLPAGDGGDGAHGASSRSLPARARAEDVDDDGEDDARAAPAAVRGEPQEEAPPRSRSKPPARKRSFRGKRPPAPAAPPPRPRQQEQENGDANGPTSPAEYPAEYPAETMPEDPAPAPDSRRRASVAPQAHNPWNDLMREAVRSRAQSVPVTEREQLVLVDSEDEPPEIPDPPPSPDLPDEEDSRGDRRSSAARPVVFEPRPPQDSPPPPLHAVARQRARSGSSSSSSATPRPTRISPPASPPPARLSTAFVPPPPPGSPPPPQPPQRLRPQRISDEAGSQASASDPESLRSDASRGRSLRVPLPLGPPPPRDPPPSHARNFVRPPRPVALADIPLPPGPPPPADAERGNRPGRPQGRSRDASGDDDSGGDPLAPSGSDAETDEGKLQPESAAEAVRRQLIDAWKDDSDISLLGDPIIEETEADLEQEEDEDEEDNAHAPGPQPERDIRPENSPPLNVANSTRGVPNGNTSASSDDDPFGEIETTASSEYTRPSRQQDRSKSQVAGPGLTTGRSQGDDSDENGSSHENSARPQQRRGSEGSKPSSVRRGRADTDLARYMRAPDYPPPPLSDEDTVQAGRMFFPYEYPEDVKQTPIERQSDLALVSLVQRGAKGALKNPPGSAGYDEREIPRASTSSSASSPRRNDMLRTIDAGDDDDDSGLDESASLDGFMVPPPPQPLSEHEALNAIIDILRAALDECEARGLRVVPRRRVHEAVAWFDPEGDGEIACRDLGPLLAESLALPIEDDERLAKLARAMNHGIPADIRVPYTLLMQAADEFALQMHRRRTKLRSKGTPFPLAILSSTARASSAGYGASGSPNSSRAYRHIQQQQQQQQQLQQAPHDMPAPTPRSSEAYRRLARYAHWIEELRIWHEPVDVEVLQMNFQNGTLFCKLVDVLMTQWTARGQVSSAPSDLFRGVHWNVRGLTRSPCLKNIETGLSVVWKQRGVTARNMPTAVQIYSGEPRAICALLRELVASMVFGGSISTSLRVQTVLNWFDRVLKGAGRPLARTVVRPPHHGLWQAFQKCDALLTVLHHYFPDAVRLDAVYYEPSDGDEIRSNAEELLGHLAALGVPSGLTLDDFEAPQADSLEFLMVLLFAIRSRLRAERAVRGDGAGGLVFRNRTFSEVSTEEPESTTADSELDEQSVSRALSLAPPSRRLTSGASGDHLDAVSSPVSSRSLVSARTSPASMSPPLPRHAPPPSPSVSSPSPSAPAGQGSAFASRAARAAASAGAGVNAGTIVNNGDGARSLSTEDSAVLETEIALQERKLLHEQEKLLRARLARRRSRARKQRTWGDTSAATSQEHMVRAEDFDHQEKLEVARSFFHRRLVVVYRRDVRARCELSLAGSQLEWKSLPSEPTSFGYILLGDVESVNLSNAPSLKVDISLQRAHHSTLLQIQGTSDKDTLTLFANLNALLLPHLHPRYAAS